MSIATVRPLVTSLLPTHAQEVISKLQENQRCAETRMFAITLLITNVVLGAIKALKGGDYRSFDANPGDGGCQVRAMELRRLVQMDLKGECSFLQKKAQEINKNVQHRKNTAHKPQNPLEEFFLEQFDQLGVSKEMEYLLHCYLSAKLRAPYYTHENGVIMTKSDISYLAKLSQKIDTLDYTFRRKIVENNQKNLSSLSLDLLRDSAMRITSLKGEEKALLITMLSEKHTHVFTPHKDFEPKTFGCLFYEIKVLLSYLKEECGIICLKNIVPKGSEAFCIFLQSQASQEEFSVLSDQECRSLNLNSPVIVFTAVMNLGKEEALKRLKQYRFSDMVLLQAAKETPYEPGSSLDDIKEDKAVEEITSYQQKETEIGNFFTLDHIYLNKVGLEFAEFSS